MVQSERRRKSHHLWRNEGIVAENVQRYFVVRREKGDFVMSMLNRRWEYWVLVVACCKMGVVLIPATHMLTPKDVAYRVNEAGVKLLFATEEEDVAEHISLALPDCKT